MMMFPNSTKAIFFDFDGTLRHSDPSSMETFYRFAAEEGFETSPEQQLQGERWVNAYWAESEDLQEDLARFGPWRDNGAFWANHAVRHLVALGLHTSEAEAMSKIITQRMQTEYEGIDCVHPNVPVVLAQLREAGYSLAIVSNRTHPYDELVESLGLREFFEFWLAAGELGVYKPDPTVLLHAMNLAGVQPHETAYVGDNYYADVLGARAAGMHPVLFDPKGIYPEVDCLVIRDITHLEPLFLACDDSESDARMQEAAGGGGSS
jgi:putative hydrolase of the HAD superfamily